jgi:Na+/H+ antiporter NhaD/arsenite permease-like protein
VSRGAAKTGLALLEVLAPAAFALALVFIATEWLHRTVIVLAGASLFVLFGVLDQHEAFDAIDLDTLGLLVGMMVIVSVTERTGVFEQVAIVAMRISRGKPFAVVGLLVVMTAVLSAFLDNLTSILLIAPITIIVASRFKMPAAPLLIMQIIASNIGGTATLVGDPPNIMIAGATGLSFNAFLVNLAPVSIIALIVVTGLLYLVRRDQFQGSATSELPEDIQPDVVLATGKDLWVPLGILLTTIAAFFVHGALGFEPATVALVGATAMLVAKPRHLDETLASIDWPTLFFFAGLFVMVGGLQHIGFIDSVAQATKDLTAGSRAAELYGILGIAAVGSAFVDNIPFTAAMIPVVEQLNETNDDSYWWALALGACFGGNATIIAAAANVACHGIAERHGVALTFRGFLAWGIPATLISLAIAAAYIWAVHL